jgi:hypothetical protein
VDAAGASCVGNLYQRVRVCVVGKNNRPSVLVFFPLWFSDDDDDDDDDCRVGSPPEVGPRFCQHSGALLEEAGDIITFCVPRIFRGSLGMYLNGVQAATGCEGATFCPRKTVAKTSFRSNKPLGATTVPDGEKRSEEE